MRKLKLREFRFPAQVKELVRTLEGGSPTPTGRAWDRTLALDEIRMIYWVAHYGSLHPYPPPTHALLGVWVPGVRMKRKPCDG